MTSIFRCTLLVSAILFTQSACDSSSVDNTPLTAMESEQMVTGVLALMADTTAAIKTVHLESDSQSDVTVACPQGGEARIVASVLEFSDEGPEPTFGLETRVGFMPSGCEIGNYMLDDGTGINVRVRVVFQGFLDLVSVEGDLTGTTDWNLMDRSGSCEVDMDVEVVSGGDNPEGGAFLAGTACGHMLRLDETDIIGVDNPATGGDSLPSKMTHLSPRFSAPAVPESQVRMVR